MKKLIRVSNHSRESSNIRKDFTLSTLNFSRSRFVFRSVISLMLADVREAPTGDAEVDAGPVKNEYLLWLRTSETKF